MFKSSTKTKESAPLLSHAFETFVSYLEDGEAERLRERRITSIQESRNESVQDFIRNRSSKL
jgi:hypothetical protein